jgi:general secretion pathway protein D
MRGGKAWLITVACCALVAACSSSPDGSTFNPPDLLDQLANADLSPNAPAGDNSPRVEYASSPAMGSGPELYPGDPSIGRRKRGPRKPGVDKTTDGYELHFADAELSELAKVILRDTLSLPYAFDPRVRGRVTISTGGPVSRDNLIAILESVLSMNRGALVVEGSLYRIVPEVEARRNAILSVDYAAERKAVGRGYGLSIVPLKYVAAETMTRMLTSLGSTQDRPQSSVYQNLLILRGTSQQREAALELVSLFDVNWMKGQSAGLFTLKNAAPEEVIKEMQQVFAADAQGKGIVRFQSIARLNAVLALTKNPEMLDEVDTWVSRLDRGGSEGDNFYVYRVENGRAKDLTEILVAAFSGSGSTVRGAEESQVSPTESASSFQTSTSNDTLSQPQSDTSGSAASSPGSLATSAPSSESGFVSSSQGNDRVRIIPDERNNKLLIKASGRDLRKILNILRRIDQPPMQVLINATLAEVTLNDNLQYGVQFFLEKNNGEAGLLGFSTGSALDIAPPVPGLNFIVGSVASNPRIILDALASETSVRVVSSPSVVVLHNQPATLQVGDEVPIITRQAQGVVNPDSPVVNEITYKNTGVILKVTPRINSNGLVTMEIEQEISSVPRTSSNDNLTPTISQRRISSTIAVDSGQMVVLGGLISEQQDRSKSGIPVLGKIPYLGDVLGGNTDNAKARTELVVFLQPVVIRDPQDASRVAEQVRAGMQSLAPRAAAWDIEVHAQSETTKVVK